MQIVIDIAEDDYYDILQYAELKVNTEFENLMIVAIKNGTPLPKGHGAIKDISQIEIPMCEDIAYETWVQVAINAAPTIIEADGGDAE